MFYLLSVREQLTFGGIMAEATDTFTNLGFDPDALRNKYREERDKRLRQDGNDQYIEVKGDFSRYVDDPYVEPGFSRESIDAER